MFRKADTARPARHTTGDVRMETIYRIRSAPHGSRVAVFAQCTVSGRRGGIEVVGKGPGGTGVLDTTGRFFMDRLF